MAAEVWDDRDACDNATAICQACGQVVRRRFEHQHQHRRLAVRKHGPSWRGNILSSFGLAGADGRVRQVHVLLYRDDKIWGATPHLDSARAAGLTEDEALSLTKQMVEDGRIKPPVGWEHLCS